MFSKSSVPRFERGRSENNLGPGTYEVPSTLVDRAAHMKGGGHALTVNAGTPETLGPGAYLNSRAGDTDSNRATLKARGTASTKENRAPTPPKRSPRGLKLTDRLPGAPVAAKAAGAAAPDSQGQKAAGSSAATAAIRRAHAETEALRRELDASKAATAAAQQQAHLARDEAEAAAAELKAARAVQEAAAADVTALHVDLQTSTKALAAAQWELIASRSTLREASDRGAERAREADDARAALVANSNALAAKEQGASLRVAAAEAVVRESERLKSEALASAAAAFAEAKRAQEAEVATRASEAAALKRENAAEAKALEAATDLEGYSDEVRRLASVEMFLKEKVEERAAEARRLDIELAEARGLHDVMQEAVELGKCAQRDFERQLEAKSAEHEAHALSLEAALEAAEAKAAAASECQAKQSTIDALLAEQQRLQADADKSKWAQQQSELFSKAKDLAEEQLKQTKVEAENWKTKLEAVSFDEGRARQREEDLKLLQREGDELSRQNQELLASVRDLTEAMDALKSENAGFRDSDELLREQLDGEAHRNAEMAGHANHKQKIRYVVKLRSENLQFREELTKARQRIMQLEVRWDAQVTRGAIERPPAGVSGEGDRDQSPPPSLASGWTSAQRTPARTPRRSGASGMPSARTPQGARGRSASGGATAMCADNAHALPEDADRLIEAQSPFIERLTTDGQHRQLLREQACTAGSDVSGSTAGAAAVGAAAAATLHKRLRELAASAACRSEPRSEPLSPTTPRANLHVTCLTESALAEHERRSAEDVAMCEGGC